MTITLYGWTHCMFFLLIFWVFLSILSTKYQGNRGHNNEPLRHTEISSLHSNARPLQFDQKFQKLGNVQQVSSRKLGLFQRSILHNSPPSSFSMQANRYGNTTDKDAKFDKQKPAINDREEGSNDNSSNPARDKKNDLYNTKKSIDNTKGDPEEKESSNSKTTARLSSANILPSVEKGDFFKETFKPQTASSNTPATLNTTQNASIPNEENMSSTPDDDSSIAVDTLGTPAINKTNSPTEDGPLLSSSTSPDQSPPINGSSAMGSIETPNSAIASINSTKLLNSTESSSENGLVSKSSNSSNTASSVNTNLTVINQTATSTGLQNSTLPSNSNSSTLKKSPDNVTKVPSASSAPNSPKIVSLSSNSIEQKETKSNPIKWVLILGGAVIGGLGLLILSWYILTWRLRTRQDEFRDRALDFDPSPFPKSFDAGSSANPVLGSPTREFFNNSSKSITRSETLRSQPWSEYSDYESNYGQTQYHQPKLHPVTWEVEQGRATYENYLSEPSELSYTNEILKPAPQVFNGNFNSISRGDNSLYYNSYT